MKLEGGSRQVVKGSRGLVTSARDRDYTLFVWNLRDECAIYPYYRYGVCERERALTMRGNHFLQEGCLSTRLESVDNSVDNNLTVMVITQKQGCL